MSNYNTALQSNNTDLQAILDTINELPDAGGSDPILQDKIVTPTTNTQTISADSGYDGLDIVTVNAIQTEAKTVTPSTSQQNITPTSGKYMSQVTINAMPTATQATPSVTINSSTGLVTATATQTSGYVTAGSKSGTLQLAFQAAQTITPGTTNKTIAANTYLGGVQTIKGDANLVASNIVSGKSIFGVVGTASAGEDPFGNQKFSYTVNPISGAQYGFALNSNGYYESQNKGINSSYAICRVNLVVNSSCDIIFDVINYAESNYDYALFSNLDTSLTLSSTADSSNVKKSFKGQQSASIVNVVYSNVTIGTHYIDIKFIKDSSQHSNNDSVQFKMQPSGSLSQETIDKIVASDPDLVAGNIKSGVDIFGIVGTYEGSSGDTSQEDGLITRTLTSYTNNRVTSIGDIAFYNYSSLTTVSFPQCTSIGAYAFNYCGCLESIYLGTSKLCTLAGSVAFSHTKITSTTGSIFVPTSLVSSYKTATNWTYFSNRIFSYSFT